MIVQAGKLAQLSGKRLQLTKAGRRALSGPAADTIRGLWSKWTKTTIHDELSRIDCVKGQTGKGKRGLTALATRRDAVSDALTDCPKQHWIATDEFLRFMRASGNDFAVTRNGWNLYIGELQYGSLGYDNGVRILEKRYLFCLLLEYAATLGLLDVALIPPAGARRDHHSLWGTDDLPYFSRYDGLMFFRINTLGAYCLEMADEYTPAPIEVKPVLRVLPDLEIAAIGEALEQGDRLALDAYAVRSSDFVWKLETGKLLSAVESVGGRNSRVFGSARRRSIAGDGRPTTRGFGRPLGARPRPWNGPSRRVRRAVARCAYRQRFANTQPLPAGGRTSPRRASLLGVELQAQST